MQVTGPPPAPPSVLPASRPIQTHTFTASSPASTTLPASSVTWEPTTPNACLAA